MRCSIEHSPARTCARPRSPPGWRSATPTRAAPLLAADALDAKRFRGRRLAQGASRRSRRPAARRAPGGGAARPARGEGVDEVVDSPARYLARKAADRGRSDAELTTLALMRMAANDADAAAGLLDRRWERPLPRRPRGLGLGDVAQAGGDRSCSPRRPTSSCAPRALPPRAAARSSWPDEMLAWKARAALRADNGTPRWQQVMQAIDAMSAERAERAGLGLLEGARRCRRSPPTRRTARRCARRSRELLGKHRRRRCNFYGALAAEDLGQPLALPPRPAPLTPAERDAAAGRSGLARALQLIAIGLRSEGVREWNYSLRGMGDRELLAAAQLACDREVWDRCINTSERTRGRDRHGAALPDAVPRGGGRRRPREIGLDPAYRLRPDPPGVALRHGRALRRRRLRPDADHAGDCDAGRREEDRPSLTRR